MNITKFKIAIQARIQNYLFHITMSLLARTYIPTIHIILYYFIYYVLSCIATDTFIIFCVEFRIMRRFYTI